MDVFGCFFEGKLIVFKFFLESFDYVDVVSEGVCCLVVGIFVFVVKMGIIVVINVLFECKGECMFFLVIVGFEDLLVIGDQICLDIFVFDFC